MLTTGAGRLSFGQGGITLPDTIRIQQQKRESVMNKNNRNSKDNTAKHNLNNQKAKGTFIKQVKGARPDMSKARGARPPDIQRPSGSFIPKGIGRPRGAVRPGKF